MALLSNLFHISWHLNIMYRAGFAFLTSVLLVIFLGRQFIRLAKKSQRIMQPIREDGPQQHFNKEGTPTLGGVIIMGAFWLSSFIWLGQFNKIVVNILLVSFVFALLGFIDDVLKLTFKNSKGLSGKIRLLLGFIVASCAAYSLIDQYPPNIATSVFFPFIHSFYIPLSIFIIFFSGFVVVGTANSVNLTDGLDGLASLVSITILITFLFLLILILSPDKYTKFNYSAIFYYNNIRQILVLLAALIGALLGFLWYNSAPAKIFMGDVGSLGIGGTLGIIAVSLKQELFLAVAGIFLVCESVSVIIQVYYFKFTGKRYFLMAPLHHHYEKKGMSETLIVKRIWIFTIIMCVLAILLLDVY